MLEVVTNVFYVAIVNVINMEISKARLAKLLRDEYILQSLYGYGVDNWVWYDNAINDDGEGTFPSARDIMYEWDDDKIIEELWK